MKKNVRLIRPLFCSLLSIVLVASLTLPSAIFVDKAFAYDAIGDVQKTLTYNDFEGYLGRTVNFNDIDDGKKDGRRDTNNPQNLAKFAVEQQIRDWAALACGIYSKTPEKLDDDDYIETMWTDSINKPNQWSVFNNEFKKDKYYGNIYSRLAGLNTVDQSDGDETITGDGLRFGNSLAAARDDLFNKFGRINGRKFGASNFKENMPIEGLNDDTERNVVYSNVACLDDLSGPGKRTINGFGIAFYDFRVGLLSPDVEGGVDGTYNSEFRNSDSPTFTTTDAVTTSAGINDSDKENSMESRYTSSHEETGTVTSEHSKTMGFGIGAGLTVNWGNAFGICWQKDDSLISTDSGFSFNINGNFNMAWEDSFSKSKSETEQKGEEYTSTISLPAHTGEFVTTTLTTGNADLNVNCPVCVSFKVAIYCATGNYYDDGAGCHYFDGYHQGTFCAKFGDRESSGNDSHTYNDAMTDLYVRASDELGHKDDESYDSSWGNLTTYSTGNADKYCPKYIPWDRIQKDTTKYTYSNDGYEPTPSSSLNKLMYNYPAVLDRATSSLKSNDYVAVFSEPIALYPIKHIQLQDPNKANLKTYTGGSIDLDKCKVRALDRDMIDYYGFNSDINGDWKIVDAEGKEVKSDLAEIKKEPGTNKVKLYANKKGTVYLRYFLHDDLVSYHKEISTNAGLDDWKGISVEIVDNTEPDAQPASIKLESKNGVATINVNNHTDLNTLYNCKLYTDSGKEVTDTYYWDVQEASGLTVNKDTGDAIATQPGTYLVRTFASAGYAGNKKIYSDWVELKAVDAASNEVTAPQPQVSTNTIHKTEPTEDLLDLVMSAYEKVQTYKENNNGASFKVTTTTTGSNGEEIQFTSKDVMQKFKDAGINADEFYAMILVYHVGKQNGKIPEETVKNVETFAGSVFTKAEIQNIQTSAKQFAYEKGYSMAPQNRS